MANSGRAPGTGTHCLLLTPPGEGHVYDRYLVEILLTEGYNCFEQRVGGADLTACSLVIISAGAAARLSKATVADYLRGGGHAIIIRPPVAWCDLFGLSAPGETYALAKDAYLRVNADHPWLAGFPALDLQVPGEADVYRPGAAEALAFLAGQPGQAIPSPAVALHRVGEGAAVVFTYDLADCLVQFHQGRPENASNGPDPDANRDGKFTPDDLLEGRRDFGLRHVPQADVHQDLLVRAIRGLTADRVPLPRLWHFPRGAPAALFVNGDGDGMIWEDLQWTVETCARYDAKFTFYLMDEQIGAFAAGDLAAMRERGHAFGPHPWVSLKPSVEEWRGEVKRIMASFEAKFGFRPQSVRSHSCIFPGWDETPSLYADCGLRLDTTFISGYRFQSGYANGSALPVRFMSRSGEVIDCYEQCTIHGDDVMASTKTLLPAQNEDECIELSLQVLHECATAYHGVYHPYFHPVYLGERGAIPTRRWFVRVLQAAQRHGMPSVSADEWLAFNDARRSVVMRDLIWRPETGELSLKVESGLPVRGLTVLLPPCEGRVPASAALDGEPLPVTSVPFEALGWSAVQCDLEAAVPGALSVVYGRRDSLGGEQ